MTPQGYVNHCKSDGRSSCHFWLVFQDSWHSWTISTTLYLATFPFSPPLSSPSNCSSPYLWHHEVRKNLLFIVWTVPVYGQFAGQMTIVASIKNNSHALLDKSWPLPNKTTLVRWRGCALFCLWRFTLSPVQSPSFIASPKHFLTPCTSRPSFFHPAALQKERSRNCRGYW